MCLLLQQCLFGRNRPRDAPRSRLRPPSNLFSSYNLQNQPLSYPQPPRPPTPFFTLTSQIRQNDSTEVEAPSTTWSACICGLTHQPLSGLLFPPRSPGSGARWPLCPRTGPGEARGRPASLENARPAWRPRPLPAPQAHLRLSGVKPRTPRTPPSSGTSTRTRPSGTCRPEALPAQPPPPSLPGEPRPR